MIYKNSSMLYSYFLLLTSRRRRGFTLVELLMFIAIFTIIIIAFIAILVAVTRVQVRQSASAAVNQESTFLLQQVQYDVESARLVDATPDVASGSLQLRMASSAIDPTIISLSNGTVYVQQGAGGTLQALTSGKVTVSNLSFTRHFNLNGSSTPYGTDSVSYSFTMATNTSTVTQYFAQSLQSSATVLAPVAKIALLQQNECANSGSNLSSMTCAYAGSNETSSLLIVLVANVTSTSAVSISDTAGNTWTKIANVPYSAYNEEMTAFAAVNAKNAANTVTATFGSNAGPASIFISEYRGAATASSFDASSSATQASTQTPSSGSANPTSTIELLYGATYNATTVETPAAGGGFTSELTSSVSTVFTEDSVQYITGSAAATWQYTNTTPSSTALIVTFK